MAVQAKLSRINLILSFHLGRMDYSYVLASRRSYEPFPSGKAGNQRFCQYGQQGENLTRSRRTCATHHPVNPATWTESRLIENYKL